MICEFETPGGKSVRLDCRPGTADATTSTHVISSDEYGLGNLLAAPIPGGLVIDVGSYIGAFAIAAAVDLRAPLVVAIEPIPENAEQIGYNATLNRFPGVLQIDQRAAVKQETVEIEYRYNDRYAWVGNMNHGKAHASLTVPGVSLSQLLDELDHEEVGLLKIDCEGCEFDFLDDPAIERVYRIVGEVHGNPDPLYDRLIETHWFTLKDYIFSAVLK